MIFNITSTQNQYIKTLKNLKNKKARTEHGLFIAEGDKCAIEAINYGLAASILTRNPECEAAKLADKKGVDIYIVNNAILEAVSDTKTPQESLAVVKKQTHTLPYGAMLYCALEDVSDPQNVGTIIRTADAAGAGAVILSEKCADYTSPKAVRAAMGSIFHIPIVVAQDFHETLNSLKAEGTCLIAGHLKGENTLPDCDSACIMIGNEARGLTDEASALADALYKINIFGKAESLNAAVAAGILMYKIADR